MFHILRAKVKGYSSRSLWNETYWKQLFEGAGIAHNTRRLVSNYSF